MTACGSRSDEEQMKDYEHKLQGYNCDNLTAEHRINDYTLQTFTTAQKTTNIPSDIALNLMTLGTDTWEDGRSMSGTKNEERRLKIYRQKNQFVENEQRKRCAL